MNTPHVEAVLAQLVAALKADGVDSVEVPPLASTAEPARAVTEPVLAPKPEPMARGGLMELAKLATTGIAAVFATLLIVSATSPKAIDKAPRILVIDANVAMARYIERPDVSALDEAAFAEVVKAYHGALEAEMQALTASGRVILLSADVVLAGDAPDVTDRLVTAALARVSPGGLQ